jgi:hypothetical protein
VDSVWIITSTYEYDNTSVLEVWSTEEKGFASARRMAESFGYEERGKGYWKGEHGNSLSVYEHELEG